MAEERRLGLTVPTAQDEIDEMLSASNLDVEEERSEDEEANAADLAFLDDSQPLLEESPVSLESLLMQFSESPFPTVEQPKLPEPELISSQILSPTIPLPTRKPPSKRVSRNKK